MRDVGRALAMALLFACSSVAFGQAMQDAREQGEDLAESLRDATSESILGNAAPNEVPGFGGTALPETSMADDPEGLSAAGEARRGDDSYATVIDPYRPTFDPTTIDLAAADLVSNDPDAYLGTGIGLAGGAGSCEPLPPGGGSSSTYLESCNDGSEVYSEQRSCSIRMVPEVTTVEAFKYFVVPTDAYGTPLTRMAQMTPHVASGVCKPTGVVMRACAAHTIYGWSTNKFCNDYNATEYVCSADLAIAAIPSPTTGKSWHEKTRTSSVVTTRVDSCASLNNNANCTPEPAGEVCTEPGETRIIDGVSVTEPCWAWERSYQCSGTRPANDCGELEGRSECTFDHQECLSEDSTGACTVYDRWYSCTAPGGTTDVSEFVCAGDLYCIDGECTEVERQASTEFKDAMVAVQTMGEMRDDFNPDTLRLFTGENLKCSDKVFGISNCCTGKGVPLLTPWLCDAQDRAVDQKDDAGLCHMVGSYCSDSFLGACLTRKQSYCCFSSKLTRILQVQGRAQLGIPWGKPKEPNCDGFLVEQFQQLDLSRMDFSEVYEEFVEAARLPDEIEAGVMIQERIAEYYDLHTVP